MMKVKGIGLVVTSALLLSACGLEGLSGRYRGTGDEVIATGRDSGRDSGLLVNGEAAIAYDPDGCQNWIIDDGLEGYSSPRFDPVSGLPVCNNKFPPGTVIGEYRTKKAGIADTVPGPGRKTIVANP